MPQETDSLFGKATLSFGPANFYWDTESGGVNLFLGPVDSMSIKLMTNKLDLKSAQGGDQPTDRAVISQQFQMTLGMGAATVERLEQIQQGFVVERDTNNVIKRLHLSNIIGQRDSSIWKQITIKEIVDGIESDDPFDIWDFWQVAPMNDSVELAFDAASQRFYATAFQTYKSPFHLDQNGRETYGASRAS